MGKREHIYEIIAENIRKERRRLGITQAELAERADVSLDTIKSVENGRRAMSLDTYLNIVHALESYDIYTKQIAKLQNDVRRITANKSGLYEDYREQLITAEELCQYQKEYESRVNEIEAQITELLYRRSLYEKDFHIDEGWEETVNKYLSKRKLTRELVEAFVSEIVFTDNNIEVKLLYDDFLKELLEVAEERGGQQWIRR